MRLADPEQSRHELRVVGAGHTVKVIAEVPARHLPGGIDGHDGDVDLLLGPQTLDHGLAGDRAGAGDEDGGRARIHV